jgi:hypothetical protein
MPALSLRVGVLLLGALLGVLEPAGAAGEDDPFVKFQEALIKHPGDPKYGKYATYESYYPNWSPFFGRGMAMDGNLLAVGADGDSSCAFGANPLPPYEEPIYHPNWGAGRCSGSGGVFLYERDCSKTEGGPCHWLPKSYIKPSRRTQWRASFGNSLALSGDTLAVYTPWESGCTPPQATGVQILYADGSGRCKGGASTVSIYVKDAADPSGWKLQAYVIGPWTDKRLRVSTASYYPHVYEGHVSLVGDTLVAAFSARDQYFSANSFHTYVMARDATGHWSVEIARRDGVAGGTLSTDGMQLAVPWRSPVTPVNTQFDLLGLEIWRRNQGSGEWEAQENFTRPRKWYERTRDPRSWGRSLVLTDTELFVRDPYEDEVMAFSRATSRDPFQFQGFVMPSVSAGYRSTSDSGISGILAFHNDTLIVGKRDSRCARGIHDPQEYYALNIGGCSSGSALIFTRSDQRNDRPQHVSTKLAPWVLSQVLMHPSAVDYRLNETWSYPFFGYQVALSGDSLVVSAAFDHMCMSGIYPAGASVNGSRGCAATGAVFTYQTRGKRWTSTSQCEPAFSDARCGWSSTTTSWKAYSATASNASSCSRRASQGAGTGNGNNGHNGNNGNNGNGNGNNNGNTGNAATPKWRMPRPRHAVSMVFHQSLPRGWGIRRWVFADANHRNATHGTLGRTEDSLQLRGELMGGQCDADGSCSVSNPNKLFDIELNLARDAQASIAAPSLQPLLDAVCTNDTSAWQLFRLDPNVASTLTGRGMFEGLTVELAPDTDRTPVVLGEGATTVSDRLGLVAALRYSRFVFNETLWSSSSSSSSSSDKGKNRARPDLGQFADESNTPQSALPVHMVVHVDLNCDCAAAAGGSAGTGSGATEAGGAGEHGQNAGARGHREHVANGAVVGASSLLSLVVTAVTGFVALFA